MMISIRGLIMVLFVIINMINIISYANATQAGTNYCVSNSDCNNGACNNSVCQCLNGYTTYQDGKPCSYQQYEQLTAFLLSFFFGGLGVDWFVLAKGNSGYIAAGVFKLLTLGGFGIWWLTDVIRLGLNSFNDGNGIPLKHCRFIPARDKVHFGQVTYPRRWGRWCSEDNECGHGFCQSYMCQCYRGYITWRFMDACNYQQRTKLTAFLVSFFIGIFGIDWFVLSRGNAGYIVAGIIKLIISLGCIIGWPIIIIIISKKKPNLVVVVNVINVILSVTSFIWWLTDWIRILANVFYDGYGAPLQPWGYNYNDRIPYRI